ncbi:gag-pol polyprotein [Tanacetum coccineum]
MTWHATGQSKENGKMNHPCDGRAWKHFDMMKPEFSGDPRNVRLGLAADGFNPFGMMSQNYSMWPPLIKELQELWKGVWTKDAATGTHFQMKAVVLWTINDFPARSSLSGWSGQGYYACPTCNEDTPSMAVKNKIVYVDMMHRLLPYGVQRYLPKNIAAPIIELCLFFKQLCAQTLMQQDMAKARKQSISIMIELEKIFPPAFFDIMIHVAIHLPMRLSRWPSSLQDDVETRFNRLGRNDDGLPEEEPDKFEVFRSVCKPTGRMKETRLTTDVMQAVVWFVLNNSPEVDADILAYREIAMDNIREKKVRDGCSEELFSLACGPTSACTYPACIVNGVKFVVHERDILHTTQCSGVSTPGLDGDVLWSTRRNSGAHLYRPPQGCLVSMEFHKNNQYILATQATQVFYIQDLATQPRGWKVVEHVYHRDVAESDQDVIHGSSSSHVTLSVGLTCLEHTDLSINAQSTEVDAPPVNDDNANANEDNADFINNEDDVVAHVLDDDDVVVSDDDEVNPSTNVEEMACVAPGSHGGDAGGSPPRRPNRPVPAQCQSSSLRIETGNASLRKAFRHNNQQPLTLGFDYADLGTFHPLRNFASMLNSFMGETVRPLPLACEWEEIPEAFKTHIYPTLESYFNLAEWYNNQDKVVVGSNVYTVGERVRLGLELKLRLLWRKNKNRIKADHYTKHDSPDEAKNHPPPPRVWGDRTQDEWNELVDCWSHPNRVSRSLQNAANRAKNTILTNQGKKSFAQGRNEYKVEKGHYEDLIETWRKGHLSKKTGEFKTEQNKQRYLDMKAMQEMIKADIIPKLPGGGSTSRRRANCAYEDVMTRDQMTQIRRQQEQEKELYKKQAEEAQTRAYLASLKADAADQRANVAYQNTESIYGALGQFFMHYNSPNSARPFTPPAFSLVPPPPPGPTMPQLTPNWAHLLQPPFPYNQPLQPPYPGPFPPIPVTNNNFNNCYHPVLNSTHCIPSSSNSQAQRPHYTLLTNPHMNDSRSCDQLAQDLARENNNECSSREEEEEEGEQQSGDDYSEEEE